MDTALGALALVFLAELGDKTQLLALGFGARHRLGPVLAGMALGYAASNLVSVVVGGLLGAALPARALGIAGGLLFFVFAVQALRQRGEDAEGEPAPPRTGRVVGSVAVAILVAELGDKTMLTTATLASQDRPALVWLGATVGIVASGAVGAVIGRVGGIRLPERPIRVGSAVLFAVFGVVLLVNSIWR